MELKNKITSFKDLIVWQKSYGLVIEIYLCSHQFPKEELYGITSQMKRSAVSIASNIAEGFSRPSLIEKARFYSIALGSTTELHTQVLICKGVDYLTENQADKYIETLVEINKMINGLIKRSKEFSKIKK